MKNIITFLLLAINLNAQGLFYVNDNNGLILENVINNQVKEESAITGKTYNTLNQNYCLKTQTNNNALIFFSNDVEMKINDLSSVYINQFEQSIVIQEIPSVIKYENDILSLSLSEGEIQISSFSTNTIISTKLANVILNKSKCYIKSDEKTTVVSVLEGDVVVMDNSSKTKKSIKTGNMVVIVKAPRMLGRGLEIYKQQNLFTVRDLNEDELKELNNSFTKILEIKSNFRYITKNNDTFGVKIN